MHRLILVLAFISHGVLFSDDARGAAARLPALVRSSDGVFLAVDDWVVFDTFSSVPIRLRGETRFSATTYLEALAKEQPTADLNFEHLDAEFIRIADGRWLLAKRHTALVRRSSIDVIDDRQGAGQISPPTAAPALGGKAVGVLAQPHVHGVTLCVGSARTFCGIRSAARSLAVTTSDIEALATLVHVPTSAELLKLVLLP